MNQELVTCAVVKPQIQVKYYSLIVGFNSVVFSGIVQFNYITLVCELDRFLMALLCFYGSLLTPKFIEVLNKSF